MICIDSITRETSVWKSDLIFEIYGNAFSRLQSFGKWDENIFLFGVQDFRSDVVMGVLEAFQFSQLVVLCEIEVIFSVLDFSFFRSGVFLF